MSDAAFIKEATEALLVEILDDDCDDLQSVRAIARTLRAAGQVIPEPPTPSGYAYRYWDGIRFNDGREVNGSKPTETLPYWFAPRASPPVEVGVTVEATDEIEKWRQFAQHCQRTVAAVKSHMTNEQVLKFLGEDMSAAIDRLASQDTSDIDPDLLAYAEQLFGPEASPAPTPVEPTALEKKRFDMYSELAEALGCDPLDSHASRVRKAAAANSLLEGAIECGEFVWKAKRPA